MVHLLFFYIVVFFFFKQKTAYEMRISDWSSDVCSSDLRLFDAARAADRGARDAADRGLRRGCEAREDEAGKGVAEIGGRTDAGRDELVAILDQDGCRDLADAFGLFLRGHDDIARTLGARAVFARGLRCLRRMGGLGLRKRQPGNAC